MVVVAILVVAPASRASAAGWSASGVPVAAQLNAISCPSTTVCFAVGNRGVIIASTNGGAWATQTSGTASNLTFISCASATMWGTGP